MAGPRQPVRITLSTQRWPFREPFVISRGTINDCETLEVTLSDADGHSGRGASHGVTYAGESIASMSADINAAASAIEGGCGREELLAAMPPGGARFAVDAALWDLEAKRGAGDPFARNGLAAALVISARTLGIRSPDQFEQAVRAEGAHAFKLKVDADDPMSRIAAARRGAPDARLIVDPNQSWLPSQLKEWAPGLVTLGVEMIEQPIPVGTEAELDGWSSPIPLCADELVDDIADLPKARGRFTAINIKLDKCGGLTAALRLADAAQALGFDLMVGCMGGPSLVMAPGMVLAQRCRWVDLDAPLFQLADNKTAFQYDRGIVARPHLPELWG